MSEATTENRMKVKNVWMIEKTLKKGLNEKTLKKGLKQKMWEKTHEQSKNEKKDSWIMQHKELHNYKVDE